MKECNFKVYSTLYRVKPENKKRVVCSLRHGMLCDGEENCILFQLYKSLVT